MKIHDIPLTRIEPDPQQPRQEIANQELNELAGSLQKRGQLLPIIVFASADDTFVAVDGHRRLAAMQLLKGQSISAIVLPERPSDEELLITQLTTSMLSVDLTPMEQALSLQRLQKTKGWSNTQIAEQLQFSKSKVTRLLSLLKLPGEAQELIKTGALKPSTAYEISRAKTPEERDQLLAKAASQDGLRRDQAKQSVSEQRIRSRRSRRTSFQLNDTEVVMATSNVVDFDYVIQTCQTLVRECKRASRQGLNVNTLCRVLKDQNAAEVAIGGEDE
ncbi:MAG: ParB/RepB/Spo0J family partition protein [Fuerstiella sp.]